MPLSRHLKTDPPSDRGPQGMGKAEHRWLKPTAVDFDREGDLDLINGTRWHVMYYENTGTPARAVRSRCPLEPSLLSAALLATMF